MPSLDEFAETYDGMPPKRRYPAWFDQQPERMAIADEVRRHVRQHADYPQLTSRVFRWLQQEHGYPGERARIREWVKAILDGRDAG